VWPWTGKAGFGKTLLLGRNCTSIGNPGVDIVSGWTMNAKERTSARWRFPASHQQGGIGSCVLRGVPATTIHRILSGVFFFCIPRVYDPEYENAFARVAGSNTGGDRSVIEGMTRFALDRAHWRFIRTQINPRALACKAGLRGSDFIHRMKRREEPLDIGVVDGKLYSWMTSSRGSKKRFSRRYCYLAIRHKLAPVGQSRPRLVFEKHPKNAI